MQYELTVVVDGELASAKKKAVQEKFEKLVNINQGKIKSQKEWGKKDLAYKIDKSTTGQYLFYELELGSKAAKDIQSKLNVEPEVIRYLLVKS